MQVVLVVTRGIQNRVERRETNRKTPRQRLPTHFQPNHQRVASSKGMGAKSTELRGACVERENTKKPEVPGGGALYGGSLSSTQRGRQVPRPSARISSARKDQCTAPCISSAFPRLPTPPFRQPAAGLIPLPDRGLNILSICHGKSAHRPFRSKDLRACVIERYYGRTR